MSRPATAAMRMLAGEREPVRVATTANIDLYGLETIDGVALAVADRVLVKNQTDGRENGIYTVSTGRWYRASDANHPRAITEGVTVHVQEGTVHGGQAFRFATLLPNIGEDEVQIAFYLSASFAADAEGIIQSQKAELLAYAAELKQQFSDIVTSDTFGATIPFDDTGVAVQAAIDVAATKSVKVVAVQGSYTLTAPLQMRPGVAVWCMKGAATFTQANGAGLPYLVSWDANVAHGACLDGVRLDMNRANNPDNVAHACIHATASIDDPRVVNCEIVSSTGHGMLFTNSRRPVIDRNVVNDCFVSGIYVFGTTRTDQIDASIQNNRVSKFGQHGIVTWNVQGSRIVTNKCIGYGQATTIHIDGDKVVWAGGTDFTNVKAGEFVIGTHSGGYFEALVLSKQSNVQITVAGVIGGGEYYTVPAVIGNGDVISISGSRDELIHGNTVTGGACLGISLFSTVNSSVDRCKVIGNTVLGTMASGYALSIANVATFARDNAFIGNFAIETGQGGAAMDVNFKSGMTVATGSNGIANLIDDNTWMNFSSAMVEGLRVTGATDGVRIGRNKTRGLPDTITGGATVALSAGWGAGAAVSDLVVLGDTISFAVAAGASGAAANPTITITHFALPIAKKQPSCVMTSTPNTMLPVITFYPDAANTSTFILNGTPSAGTYRFVVRL